MKVFGCVEVYSARFLCHCESVFPAETYRRFFGRRGARAYYPRPVHDRASYHWDSQGEDWFREQRRWWQAHGLPQCSPEDHATEPLRKHTRQHGTPNRDFAPVREL